MKEYTKNLGKVIMTPKGAWSIEKEYEILDIVHDSVTDHAYISKQEVPSGVDLSDSRYWMPLNVSGYSDSNVITLNSFNKDGEIQSYTLEEAIKTIKDVGRKSGAVLIFYNNNINRLDITIGCWEIWQFNSTNVYDWENLDAWVNIYYNYNKFVGWYAADNILNKEIPNPDVGCYAFVGNIYNEAFVYRCDIKNQWTKTNQKAQHYIKVVFGNNVSIGANGNWWQGGVDTNIPVSVKGDNGLTPYLRWNNDVIEYSYNNVDWFACSEHLISYFRWYDNKIQTKKLNSDWEDLSTEFKTNIKIDGYVSSIDLLPNNAQTGSIYGVGPTYSEDDINQTNPIYRIYVYASNGWIDNGIFKGFSAGIVQELGDSETLVMSQKSITSKINNILLEKSNKLIRTIDVVAKPSPLLEINMLNLYAGKIYRLKINSNNVISEYAVLYENSTDGGYKTIDVDKYYYYIPTTNITKLLLYIREEFINNLGKISIEIEPISNIIDIDNSYLYYDKSDELPFNGFINISGEIVEHPSFYCTDFISAPQGVTFKTFNSYINEGSYFCIYDKNKKLVRTVGSDNSDFNHDIEFELQDGEMFFRTSFINFPAGIYYKNKSIRKDFIVDIINELNEIKNTISEEEIKKYNISLIQIDTTYNVPVKLKANNQYKIRVNSNEIVEGYIVCYKNSTSNDWFELNYDIDVYYTPDVDIQQFIFFIRGSHVISPGTIDVIVEDLNSDKQRFSILENYCQELSISTFQTIGVCGDSYTAGAIYVGNQFIGEKKEVSWGRIIGRLNGVDVSVFARSGATTKSFLTDSACLPLLLSSPQKELYILNLGINDAGYALGTLDDIKSDYNQNPDTYYGNYGRIIEQIKNYAPNAKIVIMKVLASNYSDAGYKWSSNAIEEIAIHYGIPCIDTLNSPFLRSDWLTNNCKVNGGHPTAIAHSGIAKAVTNLIEDAMRNKYYDYFIDYYYQ